MKQLVRLAALAVLFAQQSAAAEEPPLTDDELGTSQQQALLHALASNPFGHRAAGHCRAGYAMLIRPHAIRSNTCYYGGYWVGGGVPIKGDGPLWHEGTFGWDYFGMTFDKLVDLNWSHGRRAQGGTRAYKTDGKRLHK